MYCRKTGARYGYVKSLPVGGRAADERPRELATGSATHSVRLSHATTSWQVKSSAVAIAMAAKIKDEVPANGCVEVLNGRAPVPGRLTPLHSVYTGHPLAFLVDFLQAAAYLTGAAAPGRRVDERRPSSGDGRCGDTQFVSPRLPAQHASLA